MRHSLFRLVRSGAVERRKDFVEGVMEQEIPPELTDLIPTGESRRVVEGNVAPRAMINFFRVIPTETRF